MAAPHVTGTVANYLAANPALTQSLVQQELLLYSTSGAVIDPGTGSPNKFLNSVFTFGVEIVGPADVPCGESRTFTIHGFQGVGPYSNFSAFLDGVQVGSTQTFTIQGDATGYQYYAGLAIQAQDARGTVSQNGSGIYICRNW